jgi:NADH:ubiquinone oxidoreductase subunit K
MSAIVFTVAEVCVVFAFATQLFRKRAVLRLAHARTTR